MSESIDENATEEVKTETVVRSMTYFAEDGNYGSAEGITVMETTHWDETDWAIIEATSDWHRPAVARALTESYEPGANEEALRAFLENHGVDLRVYETASNED